MSFLNERQKPRDFYMPVICWRCDTPMRIKTVAPTMSSGPLVYVCPACKLERQQIVARRRLG
jgi:hypothetical protein